MSKTFNLSPRRLSPCECDRDIPSETTLVCWLVRFVEPLGFSERMEVTSQIERDTKHTQQRHWSCFLVLFDPNHQKTRDIPRSHHGTFTIFSPSQRSCHCRVCGTTETSCSHFWVTRNSSFKQHLLLVPFQRCARLFPDLREGWEVLEVPDSSQKLAICKPW